MSEPAIWTPDREAQIAELWQQLLEAADAGDERARDFLATFGPWARDELAMRPKS
jgi:hypothetical protein